MKILSYEVLCHETGRFILVRPDGRAGTIVFYYTPERTKELHKFNLDNEGSTQRYFQLIGLDFELKNKAVYRRLINAYISGELFREARRV